MSYPQQPENWSDPSLPSQGTGFDPKAGYGDSAATPVSGQQPNPYGPPASGVPAGDPQAASAGYAPGYPAGYPAGYPGAYGPYGYPMAAPPSTNGLSIAAMVVAIVGMVGLCGYGLGGYIGAVGAIMGHVARRQIRERGENGDGMAMAGIIVGWIATAIAVIATIVIVGFIVWAANQDSYSSTSHY